ncbi:hypothetical protein ZWY2020_028449 [Hordeum vulgare]|nr:hypothetical protein ZWY2020_028449 [Hordeum vulgare]
MPYADADHTLRALAATPSGASMAPPTTSPPSKCQSSVQHIRRRTQEDGLQVHVEKAVDKEETVAAWIRSEGDAFLHGALPCLVDGPALSVSSR